MSRRAVGLLGLVAASAGLVVALAGAQESSRRSAANSETAPPTSASRYSLSDSVPEPQRSPGGLADRMRALRSGSSTLPATTQTSSPAAGADASPSPEASPPTGSLQPVPIQRFSPSATNEGLSPAPPIRTGALPSPQATIGGSSPPVSPYPQPEPVSNDFNSAVREAPSYPPVGAAEETSPLPTGQRPLRSVLKQRTDDDEAGPSTPRVARNPQYEPWTSRRSASTSGGASSPVIHPVAPPASPANRQSPEGLTLRSEGPALRVETTGPRAVSIDRAATYTVSIANTGNVEGTGVVVSLTLPSWVEVAGGQASVGNTHRTGESNADGALMWTIDRIAAGGNEQLKLQLIPRESRPFELAVAWEVAPAPASARVQVQEPQLQLALLGADDVLFGQNTVYTIVISNPGTGDAENVALRVGSLAPDMGDSPMQQIGNVAAGAKREIEIEVSAQQQGQLQIDVEAVAEGGLRAQTSKQVRVRRADLLIEMTGPPLKYAGTVATYQVKVVNHGDAAAESVLAELMLPLGAKYLGGIEQARQNDRKLQWSIGQLAPGNQRLFAIQCEMATAGDMRIDVIARAEGNLSVSDSVATRVEAIADVKLLVNDPQGPKAVDTDVVYELLITNRGTKSARNIQAVVQFSEGIEPLAAAGHKAEIVPGQVLFAPIDELRPGQQMSLKVTARSNKPGNHVYRAAVNSAEPEIRRVSEGTTRFFGQPSIQPAGAEPTLAPPPY